jgi:outer membrane protein TolC
LGGGRALSTIFIPIWNALIQSVVYGVAIWLLGSLRRAQRGLEQKVEQRTRERVFRAGARCYVNARVTLHLTQQQFHAGYANGLAVLSAQQAYQQAVIGRVQAQAARPERDAAFF